MKTQIKHRVTGKVIKEVEGGLNRANLYGVDLSGANFYGADLRGVDLRGANLYGVDLSEVDLRGVDLRGVRIKITQKDQLLSALHITVEE